MNWKIPNKPGYQPDDKTLPPGDRPKAPKMPSMAKGYQPLRDGEPCNHPGCLSHVTHPCEGCGRTAGVSDIGEPPKNPGRDQSKDNEIKMNMAKDMICSLMISQRKCLAEDYTEQACEMAEQIFNRFHKGDE